MTSNCTALTSLPLRISLNGRRNIPRKIIPIERYIPLYFQLGSGFPHNLLSRHKVSSNDGGLTSDHSYLSTSHLLPVSFAVSLSAPHPGDSRQRLAWVAAGHIRFSPCSQEIIYQESLANSRPSQNQRRPLIFKSNITWYHKPKCTEYHMTFSVY